MLLLSHHPARTTLLLSHEGATRALCTCMPCPAGFFTGRKKESMFKVPEGGKVGVIGSGRGVTEYKKATRHEFNVEEGGA